MAPQPLTTAVAATRRLQMLRSKIFQSSPPPPVAQPGGVRNGSKVLKPALRGPAMLGYYHPILKMGHLGKIIFKDTKDLYTEPDEAALLEDLTLRTDREEYQHGMTLWRRSLGRGKPKKGEGKRASLKSKGKKK